MIHTMHQATSAVAEIGRQQATAAALQLEQDLEIAEVRARYRAAIECATAATEALTSALQIFADSHREMLTASGAKTVKTSAGDFGWRASPPKVVGLDDLPIDRLEVAEPDCVVRKPKADLTALKRLPKDRLAALGLSLANEELFFVAPKEPGGAA